jgi:RNA polymerase sigma-70 factor (ECF subfamily)
MTNKQPAEGDEARARFERLFTAHYDELLRFTCNRLPPDSAPDVVSEVFLVAWRRRAEIPADNARPWLYGVTRGVLCNERRTRQRRGRLQQRLEAVAHHREGNAAVAPDHQLVHEALSRLSGSDQHILKLVEWDDLDTASAAAVAGCSHTAFKVRLHRARRRFAAALNALAPITSAAPRGALVVSEQVQA